jgi:hypothetical protein
MISKKNTKIIFWSISLITIGCLWFFQYLITVNIPWWDDFHGIMLPVYHLFSDAPISEKLQEFVSLNNEHRVINDRLFNLAIYLIFGVFEMKILAMLGFINLILIFFLLYKVTRPYNANILTYVPVIFLIFNAQYFESLQSLMVPFQNFSVILYVFLSLYFLLYYPKNGFKLSFLFAIIALFTHGNGILMLVLGALILLVKKKYKNLGIWIALSVVLVFVYFLGYHKPAWNPNISPTEHPLQAFLYVFEFLGSYALNITDTSTGLTNSSLRVILPTAMGLTIVILFTFFFLKKYTIISKNYILYLNKLSHSKTDLFLTSSILFFLATGLLIGWTRTGFPMVSRYTINSHMLIALVYLFLVQNIKNNRSFILTISGFSFFMLVLSYYNNLDEGIMKRKNAETDGLNWRYSGTWANQYFIPKHVELLNPLLTEMYQTNDYVFPKNELEDYRTLHVGPKSTTSITEQTNDNLLSIEAIYPLKNDLCEAHGLYFSIENEAVSFIFPAKHRRNNPIQLLKQKSFYDSNVKASFPLFLVPKGTYKLFEIQYTKDSIRKFETGKTISNF